MTDWYELPGVSAAATGDPGGVPPAAPPGHGAEGHGRQVEPRGHPAGRHEGRQSADGAQRPA